MTDADLYTAIQADPQAAAMAAAGNDAGCAARVAAILPPVQGVIPAQTLLMWGAATGVRGKIEAKIADQNVGSICLAVRDLLSFGGTFDSGSSGNQSLVGALVTFGIMTQADAGSLLALGQSPQQVTADAVSRAMLPHRPNGKV